MFYRLLIFIDNFFSCCSLFHILGSKSIVVCYKDKEQDKLKGPMLPEHKVTGLLSLCHNVTIATSQHPPKQHALFLSHPI